MQSATCFKSGCIGDTVWVFLPGTVNIYMLSVLMFFLIPVGGGIPAGVLLASAKGLAWPMTAGLYFVSDVILAIAFEPILRLLIMWGEKSHF